MAGSFRMYPIESILRVRQSMPKFNKIKGSTNTTPLKAALSFQVDTSERRLQKVIRRPWTLVPALIARGGVELGEFTMIMNSVSARLFDRIIHLHNGRLVTTAVAIVGSRKNSNNLAVVLPLVAFHNQLMSTSNKVKAVNVRKLLSNILTKRVTSPTR